MNAQTILCNPFLHFKFNWQLPVGLRSYIEPFQYQMNTFFISMSVTETRSDLKVCKYPLCYDPLVT